MIVLSAMTRRNEEAETERRNNMIITYYGENEMPEVAIVTRMHYNDGNGYLDLSNNHQVVVENISEESWRSHIKAMFNLRSWDLILTKTQHCFR